MEVEQGTLNFTRQVKVSKEMGDGVEWCIIATGVPQEQLDVNKLRAWLDDLFPGTKTLMNQVKRTGNVVLLSFKSLLLAELVLDACSRCTSFCWRRTYRDSSLAGLEETTSVDPSTLVCIHGICNQDAQAYLSDDSSGVKRTWSLPENELVIEMLGSYDLNRLPQKQLIIWRSEDFMPNIMRKTTGYTLPSPDLTPEKKKNDSPTRKRLREEEEERGRNPGLRQKLCPDQWNENRRHTTPQEKLVLRRLPDGFRCDEMEMFFKQIPRSRKCWCRVVATREKNTAIVELASEVAANQIMDEYVRKPENFRGLAIYRDRAYIRPGSVNKKHGKPSGEERAENPEPVIVEGFSSELEHPELRGSLCELLERVFAGNRSITECGASLLREFHLRHNRAFVSLNSNAAVEAILSLEKPLFLGGRALRFRLASDDRRRYYHDEGGNHRVYRSDTRRYYYDEAGDRDETRRYYDEVGDYRQYHHDHEESDNRCRRYPGHCAYRRPYESEGRKVSQPKFDPLPRYAYAM